MSIRNLTEGRYININGIRVLIPRNEPCFSEQGSLLDIGVHVASVRHFDVHVYI